MDNLVAIGLTVLAVPIGLQVLHAMLLLYRTGDRR
jgi:hypothetical protein